MTTCSSDWSGSAAQRKPQGTCSPPTPVELICDWIPAGTPVFARNKRTGKGIIHTTRVDLQITETLKRTHKSVTFAQDDWIVSVALKHIRPSAKQNQKHSQTTERSEIPSACVGQGTKPGDGP
jgi:hypothetical protein